MWRHDLIKATKYDGQDVKWAHRKLNGHRLTIFVQRSGQPIACSAKHDITEHVKGYPWWLALTKLPPFTSVDGELHHPGQPPSYVKHALAYQIPLQFTAFAIPFIHEQPQEKADLQTAQEWCCMMGIGFAPFIVLQERHSETWLLTEALRLGLEGWVLKTSHYRDWYKLKLTLTVDAVVTGIKPGFGKYRGQAGALLCSLEGEEIASVSGMTDAQRREIDDQCIGRVVEIEYQYVGTRGRLVHPRFVRWRDDKEARHCKRSQLE